jgi:hypothetical protein
MRDHPPSRPARRFLRGPQRSLQLAATSPSTSVPGRAFALVPASAARSARPVVQPTAEDGYYPCLVFNRLVTPNAIRAPAETLGLQGFPGPIESAHPTAALRSRPWRRATPLLSCWRRHARHPRPPGLAARLRALPIAAERLPHCLDLALLPHGRMIRWPPGCRLRGERFEQRRGTGQVIRSHRPLFPRALELTLLQENPHG